MVHTQPLEMLQGAPSWAQDCVLHLDHVLEASLWLVGQAGSHHPVVTPLMIHDKLQVLPHWAAGSGPWILALGCWLSPCTL